MYLITTTGQADHMKTPIRISEILLKTV